MENFSIRFYGFLSLFVVLVSLVQLTGCASSPNPQKEYQSIAYGSPLSKTFAKRVQVAEFSGGGVTALHAYLPIGSQIDVMNPVTSQRVSARVIGRTPKNQQNKLLLSPDAVQALGLNWYPNVKMLMRVSRKTNVSTWSSRAQKKLTAYIPSKDSVKGVFHSIPRVKSNKIKLKKGNGDVVKVQYGKASYYAGKFNGRKTASGERFNMNAMTCAHPSLPFGTLVRVTNQSNARSVVLRVNDRGPFAKGRIVDVSLAAAKRLGMIGGGTASVKLEVLR